MIFRVGDWIRSGGTISRIEKITLENRTYIFNNSFAWWGLETKNDEELLEVDTNTIELIDKENKLKKVRTYQGVCIVIDKGFFHINKSTVKGMDKEYITADEPIQLLDKKKKDLIQFNVSGDEEISLFSEQLTSLNENITKIWTLNDEGHYRLQWSKDTNKGES
jgi:hypothetical protein